MPCLLCSKVNHLSAHTTHIPPSGRPPIPPEVPSSRPPQSPRWAPCVIQKCTVGKVGTGRRRNAIWTWRRAAELSWLRRWRRATTWPRRHQEEGFQVQETAKSGIQPTKETSQQEAGKRAPRDRWGCVLGAQPCPPACRPPGHTPAALLSASLWAPLSQVAPCPPLASFLKATTSLKAASPPSPPPWPPSWGSHPPSSWLRGGSPSSWVVLLGCSHLLEWVRWTVQLSSGVQSCLTIYNPMGCSTPGLPVHHQLPELLKLMSIESVLPSNYLILCHPLLLLL